MGNEYFFAQDLAGNTRMVRVTHHPGIDSRVPGHHDPAQATPRYALDDGSQVKRIDNDTFQVAGTGAYITIVRE